MDKYIFLGWPIVIILLLSSCIKDGEIECPDLMEKIRIELQWLDTQPKDENETLNLTITPTNGETIETTTNRYGKQVELYPGTYTISAWETANNITVNGRTISVATDTDGFALQPDSLSGGATTTEVILTTDSLIIPVPVHQQTRELIVEVDFTGDGMSIVDGLEGILSGITLSRDITNGFPPTDNRNRPPALSNGNIRYNFSPNLLRDRDEWYYGRNRLIGVDGDANQVLDLRVSLATNDTTEISIDVTSDLLEFHTKDIHEPWYIIITLNLGINLELEIVDWYAGAESWITAR